MAAPTTAARVKKTLANPEPSTHGPTLPTWALHQVGSYQGYTGRPANVRLLRTRRCSPQHFLFEQACPSDEFDNRFRYFKPSETG